jgi:Ca-activated chloride channel homolog
MRRPSRCAWRFLPSRGSFLFAVGLAAVVLPAAGTRAAPQFASSVDLVEVYATVTDRAGVPVTGLQPADFEVLEDGRPQAIQAFAAGDFPLSVALAIDSSASMAGSRLRAAAGAARRFLNQLRAEDQVMILGVSSEVTVLAPLSTDRAAHARAIDGLRPWGATSLNDATIAGIDLIQPARGRRGLVILSDGEDRYSEAQPHEVLARARRADVLVYPIAVGRGAPAIFAEVAALTGGRSFHPRNEKEIDRALTDIAAELRTQYLLGYAPARQRPAAQEAGWHSIEVRVRKSDLRVRARDGYFGQ